MGFMEQQIEYGPYASVETLSAGTQIVPGMVFSAHRMPDSDLDDAQDLKDAVWDFIDATDYDDILEVETKYGWHGRMSAPGFMDATDWIAGDSEREVSETLDEYWGDDDS